MSKKESFVCYTEWLQYFDMLKTDAERAEIARAMFQYNIDGTVPCKSTHSTSFMVLFAMMRNQFDRDNNKYLQKVEKLRDNARKSHQANATNCYQLQANATNCYQIEGVNVNDNVNDNVNVINISASAQRKRFVKPTVEEVRAYCQERGNTVDAETFVNFYESKGWMVGKNHMKDWKSAVLTWERSRKEEPKPQETFSSFETDEFFMAAVNRSQQLMSKGE